MAETILKRQYITDSDGTPVGIILPIEEFALVKEILEQRFPEVSEAAQEPLSSSPDRSIKDAEFFGMWADRKDMAGKSSRDWLKALRAGQWSRS